MIEWKNLILIAIGGSIGAMGRFSIGLLFHNYFTKGSSWGGTFFVNTIGSFLLGLILGSEASKEWFSLLGIGLLGAFTTFSTFKMETVGMLLKKEYVRGILYLVITYIVGILCAFYGYSIGR